MGILSRKFNASVPPRALIQEGALHMQQNQREVLLRNDDNAARGTCEELVEPFSETKFPGDQAATHLRLLVASLAVPDPLQLVNFPDEVLHGLASGHALIYPNLLEALQLGLPTHLHQPRAQGLPSLLILVLGVNKVSSHLFLATPRTCHALP